MLLSGENASKTDAEVVVHSSKKSIQAPVSCLLSPVFDRKEVKIPSSDVKQLFMAS